MARKHNKKNKHQNDEVEAVPQAEEVEESVEVGADAEAQDADAAAEEAEAAADVEETEAAPREKKSRRGEKEKKGDKKKEKKGDKKGKESASEKKSAPRRIRRSDTIQGIRKRALTRILRVAGVKRVKTEVYEELRAILRSHIEGVVNKAVTFMEHDRRTTLQPEDLKLALESRGIRLAAGVNKNAKTQSLKSCVNRTKKASKGETDGAAEKKKHRFKPGTVAQREVAFYQKHSDCVFIPKKNFRELVREVGQDYSDKLRYADDMFDLFQLAMEQRLREICSNANKLATHAHRQGIIVDDIKVARDIMKDDQ